MKAAVVYDFHRAPTYETFPDPEPAAEEFPVMVSAAALSPLVRSQASGAHYSSKASFPFIPGFDGVGRTADGKRIYFSYPKAPYGTMAERTISSPERSISIPDSLDDITAAAIANPGMSSWAAFTRRAKLERREAVLINGATGGAGRLAIQIAKHLGASYVVATGRDEAAIHPLPEFGADETISLAQPAELLIDRFREAIRENKVRVIVDYLWGPSAEQIISAIAGHGGTEAEPRMRYVQIGGVTGDKISLLGGALRSSGLELMGSGIGSISAADMLAVIEEMFQAAGPSGFQVDTETAPLRQVAKVWNRDTAGRRLVFTV